MIVEERVWICDTITGAKIGLLPSDDMTWARVLNGGAGGSTTVLVNDPDVPKFIKPRDIKEVQHTLVYEADKKVVAAGIITSTDYDKDAGTLTLGHDDLWWLLALRLAIDHGPNNSEKTILSWTGLSLGTIIKRLLQEAVWPDRSWYALPLALPADVSGAEARKYFGYSYQYIADAIRELMEVDGGPDVDFEPRWSTSDRLEYNVRMGEGMTSGKVWEINLDAPESPVSGVKRKTTTDRMTTNAYSLGEGSEKNMLVRSHPNLDPAIPAMERTEPYKTVKVAETLSKHAQERIRALSRPTEQWSMDIFKDGANQDSVVTLAMPRVSDLRLGDQIRIYSTADPVLPVGWTTLRLIQFSGSLSSPDVSLQFQQIGA
ncbi:hypothetical protein [Specibacter sp. NPDC078692]|uniref:hypothetical protein n=1 Tax=Specibacter sp. NPDC078692 TaxID=3155818 RepID=UPI00341E7CAB